MEKRMKEKRFKLQSRKPSIKITVSADTPGSSHLSPATPPLPSLSSIRKIVSFDGSSDGSITRVSVDDSKMDYPNCIDFGIKDFLCCKDEVDLELSSDTDTSCSFLEATPPHRFSDSEFDGQIDIMSITLDSTLNMGPKPSLVASQTISKDDAFTIELTDGNDNTDDHDGENQAIVHTYEQAVGSKDKDVERGVTDSPKKPARLPLPPPKKPFKRHISLPASIFMSYLLAEQTRSLKAKGSASDINDSAEQNRSSDSDLRNTKNERFATRKLEKIAGSYSSTESTDTQDRIQGYSSNASESSGYLNCYSDSENKGTLSREDSESEEFGRKAFTSEIERKSLVLRYMRRLVRQNTTGNFAPPDYCI